ncbi:MAG TPA: MerR family DNA-binding protein [Burkholderiales bacterium]|nr:MerR family DNA-binding protein [Burkholderiales bacterium]
MPSAKSHAPAASNSLPLKVGELAAAGGVNVETVRYYQRIGLMPTPERPLGGQRAYAPELAERLRFIRRAQELGFSLAEVSDLLKLESGTDRASVRRIAGQRLAQIRAHLADLERMAQSLQHLLDVCAHTPGRHRCPIIKAITGGPAAAIPRRSLPIAVAPG